jgi:hypothetical protein
MLISTPAYLGSLAAVMSGHVAIGLAAALLATAFPLACAFIYLRWRRKQDPHGLIGNDGK